MIALISSEVVSWKTEIFIKRVQISFKKASAKRHGEERQNPRRKKDKKTHYSDEWKATIHSERKKESDEIKQHKKTRKAYYSQQEEDSSGMLWHDKASMMVMKRSSLEEILA